MEPPNNESIGTTNFFHYLEVFFIERYKSIEECANGTLGKFHYERFFTIGGVHYRRFHRIVFYCKIIKFEILIIIIIIIIIIILVTVKPGWH